MKITNNDFETIKLEGMGDIYITLENGKMIHIDVYRNTITCILLDLPDKGEERSYELKEGGNFLRIKPL